MSGETIESEEPEYLQYQKRVTQKLLEATNSKTVTEFMVKLIYGEDFSLPVRLLTTKVEASGKQVPELADAVELISSYNNFRGEDLASALRDLHNKGYLMHVSFGREASPVVYVSPPYWTHQASNSTEHSGRQYTSEEIAHMTEEILNELRDLNPDELDVLEHYGVRAWWD